MGDYQPTPSRGITPSGRRSRLRVVSGRQESLHNSVRLPRGERVRLQLEKNGNVRRRACDCYACRRL
ncbi:hypothetical protein CSUI_004647 [Cystoisospora suis]|uniref:Uncharacterized protein n=1 Tax=Cystoisospora suis TaxID=483139 RepID=A0A2C6L063_9APIC|nr:hypothetical protein CSUI_004647 [Cystoisospora suis]